MRHFSYCLAHIFVIFLTFPRRHGDLVFVQVPSGTPQVDIPGAPDAAPSISTDALIPPPAAAAPAAPEIVEDPVDLILYKEDGTIERKRDHKSQLTLKDLPIMVYPLHSLHYLFIVHAYSRTMKSIFAITRSSTCRTTPCCARSWTARKTLAWPVEYVVGINLQFA